VIERLVLWIIAVQNPFDQPISDREILLLLSRSSLKRINSKRGRSSSSSACPRSFRLHELAIKNHTFGTKLISIQDKTLFGVDTKNWIPKDSCAATMSIVCCDVITSWRLLYEARITIQPAYSDTIVSRIT
jgi:hypothetical protein